VSSSVVSRSELEDGPVRRVCARPAHRRAKAAVWLPGPGGREFAVVAVVGGVAVGGGRGCADAGSSRVEWCCGGSQFTLAAGRLPGSAA
jgi:hypothetical protein